MSNVQLHVSLLPDALAPTQLAVDWIVLEQPGALKALDDLCMAVTCGRSYFGRLTLESGAQRDLATSDDALRSGGGEVCRISTQIMAPAEVLILLANKLEAAASGARAATHEQVEIAGRIGPRAEQQFAAICVQEPPHHKTVRRPYGLKVSIGTIDDGGAPDWSLVTAFASIVDTWRGSLRMVDARTINDNGLGVARLELEGRALFATAHDRDVCASQLAQLLVDEVHVTPFGEEAAVA